MNKSQLIDEIAARADITKIKAKEALEAFFDAVSESLKEKVPVRILGFGTFKVNHRAERDGHNPQTREKIKIPACCVPVFSSGKSLKDSVNFNSSKKSKSEKSKKSEKATKNKKN